MIAVINYGLGNLHSVQKAIAFIGGNAEVTDDPETIIQPRKSFCRVSEHSRMA